MIFAAKFRINFLIAEETEDKVETVSDSLQF